MLGRAEAVIIESGPDNPPKHPNPNAFDFDFDPSHYSPEQIFEAVRKAGIVGMGGAGFPTSVKIKANPQSPITDIIINACECEPFITCDYRLMLDWTCQVLAGVSLISRALNCKNIYIGIEDNKPDAIATVKKSIDMLPFIDAEVVALKTRYPQGGERQLIKAVLDKEVPTGGIPPMIGVLVSNVATCAAIAEAVELNSPLTHRVVTVSGRGIKKPGNFYAPVGMAAGDLIELAGGMTDDAVKVILGGPMMGFSIADLSTPTTKTSGAITVLTSKDMVKRKETPCIRCGRCVAACPVNINPTKIAHAVKNNMLDVAKQYYMSACIECGCCSYSCPADIDLTGYIKTGKILVARAKKLLPA
ncbi:MAG: Electron transport complex protein RnfC [Planctomycetes bacterium ADurb.Bin401]|nr:MAG: Electron transport complex protein RnfC [Planctomycetes bacterium ADurb.Bin401]